MISVLALPGPLRARFVQEACNAFPRECCGLVEGTLSGARAQAIALHATQNLAPEHDAFEVDPAIHLALLRQLRGTGRGIIGCYHSHPNGRPDPSVRDCAAAAEEGFLWLITAIDGSDCESAAVTAFVSTGYAFSPVRIACPSLDRLEAPPV